MSPAQLLFDTAVHLPPHRLVTRKTSYQALGEAPSETKGQQQRPQRSAEESKATQILSHQAKTGTRVCFLWRKQGLGHGSGFGPGSAFTAPPLLPGDCTEESNQGALIAQAGEARRPLRLRVNEQYAFQKYLS